jgi:hypothetical protein
MFGGKKPKLKPSNDSTSFRVTVTSGDSEKVAALAEAASAAAVDAGYCIPS